MVRRRSIVLRRSEQGGGVSEHSLPIAVIIHRVPAILCKGNMRQFHFSAIGAKVPMQSKTDTKA